MKGRLTSVAKHVQAFGSKLMNLKTMLLGLVGIGGLGAFAKQVLSLEDAVAKTSAKLGIATEELRFLQFASELSGFSTEKLNVALQGMTRRVNEAAHGTGEAVNALAELNLDAAQLTRLAPDQQFLAIGRAIQRFPQPDKIRLAMKLFDAEGVGAINVFASNLKDARHEFERLGGGASAEGLQKLEAFNDSMFKLQFYLRNVARDLLIKYTGPILEFIDQIDARVSGLEVSLSTGRLGKVIGGLALLAQGAGATFDFSQSLGQSFAANSALMGGNLRTRQLESQLRSRQRDLSSRGVNTGPTREMVEEQRRTRLLFENYLRRQEGRPEIVIQDSGI
jgi:hypothetical protein